MIPKYGEEKAARLERMILANYTRVAVIDTGTYDVEQFRDYLETAAAFYGLPIEYLPGSLRLLEKLVERAGMTTSSSWSSPGACLDERPVLGAAAEA